MADLTLNPFGENGKLHIINWRLVVSSDEKIGDIQMWLDEIENIDPSIMTVFTPKALVEYYEMPDFLDHTIKIGIGDHYRYNSYKVTKVTKNICAVEEIQ